MNATPAATDVRQHILDVAKPLLLAKGFTAVGLAEVLAAAHVPKGSFYHYFGSKEAFGQAILEDYFAEYLERMDALLVQPGSAAQRLIGYFDDWLDSQTGDEAQSRCLAVKLGAEVCDLSESMRVALERGTAGVIDRLAGCIEAGCTEGSLPLAAATVRENGPPPIAPSAVPAKGPPPIAPSAGAAVGLLPASPATPASRALATVLYQTWLGAGLLAKFTRNRAPLDLAMTRTRELLGLPPNP